MFKTISAQQTKTVHTPSADGQTPYVYRVVIEPDADRFYAEIPSLPGCYSWGYTYEEALKNIKESLELYLEVAAEDGRHIPRNGRMPLNGTALSPEKARDRIISISTRTAGGCFWCTTNWATPSGQKQSNK